jgi:hypothetical protein
LKTDRRHHQYFFNSGIKRKRFDECIALQICRYGIDRIIDAGSPQTQHSCDGINASTVATEMAKDLKLTDGNPIK